MVATVWNSADKGANIALSTVTTANDTAEGGTAAWQSVRATNSFASGKIYWEIKVVSQTTVARGMVGFGLNDFSLANFLGATTHSYGRQDDHNDNNTGFTVAGADASTTFTTGDVINCAADVTAGKFWIGKNGSYLSSGNPGAGTSPYVTFTALSTIFPAISSFNAAASGGLKATLRANSSTFTGTIPSGFQPLDPAAFSMTASPLSFALTFVAATMRYGRRISALPIAYSLTFVANVMHYGRYMTALPLSFALTLKATILAVVVQPASKLKRRITAFLFSKRRVTDPTLGD